MSRRPTIPSPTVDEVDKLVKDWGFTCDNEELIEFQEMINAFLPEYARVYDLPERKLPIKYPRNLDSVFKPRPEDNEHNAWSMRMSITGNATGKLYGKRVAVKDNIQIAGVPMVNGSELIRGYTPSEDATVVSRVLDAGGEIIGTTNTPDMCFSGASWLGINGPVLNPHDKTRSSGGSSSGSAVAVQLGEADLALGGDQGGSIRIPASWCGIVGLKPTHGLVPYTGIIPIECTIDHVGPQARTVADCALFLEVLAGNDGLDPRQYTSAPVPEYTKALSKPLSGRKVGFVTEGFLNCHEEVVNTVKQSLQHFRKAGIIVEEVSIPWHKDGKAVWTPIAMEGAIEVMLKNKCSLIGMKGHKSTSLVSHMHNTMQAKASFISKPLQVAAIAAQYVLDKSGPMYYAKAGNLVREMTKAYDDALEKYDVLVMPTLPYVAPKLPTEKASIKETCGLAFGMMQNTAPFNTTGHPDLTITAGYTSDYLPVGLSIIGKHFDEETVLAYASVFEKNRDKQGK